MSEANKNNTQKIDPSLFLNQESITPFICPVCKFIVSEPTMDNCGCSRLYCKSCIDDYLKTHDNICIVSGKESLMKPLYIPWCENHIKSFEMKCKNFVRGCIWKGKLKELNDHLVICKKEQITCPNKECNEIVLREDFENHKKNCKFNPIICNLCGLQLIKEEINKHDLECMKKEILCPQNCGEKFERNKLQEHLNICKMTIIDCPFKAVGCEEKFQRINISEKNKNIDSHLNLLLIDYLKFKEKITNKLELFSDRFKNIEYSINEKNKNQNNIDEINKKYIINNINSEIKNINMEDKKILSHNREMIEQNYKIFENDSCENNKYKIDSKKINVDIVNSKQSDKNQLINEETNSFLGKKRENEMLHNSQEINPFLNNEEQNKNIYNIKDLIEGFTITGNIVGTNKLDGTKHCFVFADDSKRIKADASGSYTVKFNVLKENKWLALGFCDKKQVKINKFNFAIKGETESNGCFIISTISMIWHCIDKKQRKKISAPGGIESLQSKNTEFECRYTPLECLIDFYVNDKYLASLKDVRPTKSHYLTPCIIFLKNCEVQTTFNY